MSVISAQSISQAHKESEVFRLNGAAEKEFNIHNNDGMTLKVAQDNKLDVLINTIDGRRIKLEKQAEILHDYYGDRLLAKELFDQYLSFKRKTGGLANLLSVGIIGANLYSRVMKNSVFMGKIGTACSILGLQYAGRYLSNNRLESMIERPWKIHCVRMSKGLGPTNVPSNFHKEFITSPLRFITLQLSPGDLLFGTERKAVPAMMDIKVPIDQEHYPYFPDEEDMNKLGATKTTKPKRYEKIEPEDDGKFIPIPEKFHNDYPFTGKWIERYYNKQHELFKTWDMRAGMTIWRPEQEAKKIAFQASSPEALHKDGFIEKNLYTYDPVAAELDSDLPIYARQYTREINLTEDRIKLLRNLLYNFRIPLDAEIKIQKN